MSSLVTETDTPSESEGSKVVGSEKTEKIYKLGCFSISKKHIIPIVIVIILVAVAISVSYCKKEGLTPDSVVSRRTQPQVRDDVDFNKTWNLKEFEKSVSLINRQSV